jgi:hypothetical protein
MPTATDRHSVTRAARRVIDICARGADQQCLRNPFSPGFTANRKVHSNDLEFPQRTPECKFTERRFEQLFRSLSVGTVSRLGSGNFLERRLELELADGRRGISHYGVSSVHVHDAHVHESRGLQVILRTALVSERHDLLHAADIDRDPRRVRPPQWLGTARGSQGRPAPRGDCEAFKECPTRCGASRMR